VLSVAGSYAQSFCIEAGSDQKTGEQDGYRYELWNQNSQGTACMTLKSGALFRGEWIDVENYLARRGLGYDQTKEHQEIGSFYAKYNCDYTPSPDSTGNSYLSVYGWTVDPLIEFYIIEDWRNWIPSMADDASFKGSFYANGSFYDIYENVRINQPSIQGITTFTQYFSIRRDKRSSGLINISEHFKMWEKSGLDLGKMHEVSFVVEGYHNSGSFNFNDLDLFVE
jgi:endo-1,4-beta-xylanase